MNEQQIAAHVEELNLRIEALETQRNRALTEGVVSAGQLGLAKQRISALEKQLSELTKPKDGPALVA